jgi:hypothetical protein
MHLVGTIDTNDRRLTRNIEVSLSPNPAASFGFGAQGYLGLPEGLQVAIHALGNRQSLGQEVLHQRVWKIGKGFHGITF